MSVDGNYPSLLELSLVGNELKVLDFSALVLPKLEVLNVSNNQIDKLVLRGKLKPIGCPHLKSLMIRFNRLKEFEVPADSFPELERLGLSFNAELKALNLKGFRCLKKLDASNTLLQELKFEGDYPKLDELTVNMTKLGTCNLSRANMPKLAVLSFSSNQLRAFEFPMNLQSIVSINLDHNRLTELSMGNKKTPYTEMPRLRDLFLQCNNLNKVDLTPLGLCVSLTFIDVSLNDTISLIFCREVELEQKTIKRVTIELEEATTKWMVNNCPGQILD